MKRFGLIGHPLGHSFSKAYFTEKFNREGVDACYELFDLADINELPGLIKKYPDLRGFNVTIPYKEAIIPYLYKLDSLADVVGAVNTVKVLRDGRLIGFNTDVYGFAETLYEVFGGDRAKLPKAALVLGTGGASLAVHFALRELDVHYTVVSRSVIKGDYLYEELTPEIILAHPLIINATPVGMAPNINEAPMIPYEAITSEHILFDLIYNPEETLFLRYGRERGATTVNGMKMLHTQADAAWEIWNRE